MAHGPAVHESGPGSIANGGFSPFGASIEALKTPALEAPFASGCYPWLLDELGKLYPQLAGTISCTCARICQFAPKSAKRKRLSHNMGSRYRMAT
jgi:hypothetical protein